MENNKKKKLLILTDSPLLHTGLGRICKEISVRLFEKYEVAIAGWHFTPKRHNFPIFIYPIIKESSVVSETQLKDIISDFEPEVVLCIGDIWDFFVASKVFAQCKEINENFKAIAWITVDGEWTADGWGDILKHFDVSFPMSKFGVKEISNLTSRCLDRQIYPGVDIDVFNKLNMTLKTDSIPLDIANTFTILNIGQNCDRKNIPTTIDVFKEFQKDKNDVFLFLATNVDSPMGHNIWSIIRRNQLSKNVTIVKNIDPLSGVEDKKVNLLYNICKVNVNTSIGEGLCLPVLEGMSAGCVPVVTDYAATPEVMKDCGETIEVAEHIYGAYGVIRAIPSKKDLLKKLNMLYEDWKKYKDCEDKSDSVYFNYSKKCIEKAKEFHWDIPAKEIDTVIQYMYKVVVKRDFIKKNMLLDDLKLAMVIPSWGKNCGIAEYTKHLSENMEKNNTKITIFSDYDLNKLVPHLNKFNCVYIQHEYSFFQNRLELESFLDKAREANVKTIMLMHTFAPVYPYINMVIDKTDVLLFHNETFKKLAMKQRADATNVRVVPMGCLPILKEDNVEIKQKLGVENKSPVIGSFGFLRDQKGYNELVLAIKEMRTDYPDIRLLIVAPPHEFGSKSYDEDFFRFIEDQGMQKNIILVRDYLEDSKLLKTLNACDIMVLNYKDAPSCGGNSAACKTLMRICKPIITPNSIAFLDLNDEVYKINNLNKNSIISTIKEVLNNKEIYDKLSNNAEEHVRKNDWLSIAKKHLDYCKTA